jgi:enoyl-CoA hydratase
MEKPVIGAVNGAAITGGFELLNCDSLIALNGRSSATRTRAGVMPGWGYGALATGHGVRARR